MANLLNGTRIFGNLVVDTGIAAGNLTLAYGTVSTSTSTGALVVTGGVGIGGTLTAGQINTTGNVLGQAGTFNALTVNGAATVTTAPASTSATTDVPNTTWVRSYGGFQAMVVYTNAGVTFSNTSATFPSGITKAKVTVVAGGGAGGLGVDPGVRGCGSVGRQAPGSAARLRRPAGQG